MHSLSQPRPHDPITTGYHWGNGNPEAPISHRHEAQRARLREGKNGIGVDQPLAAPTFENRLRIRSSNPSQTSR
jgi:hypothetical protein